jgi:hypothetical protein
VRICKGCGSEFQEPDLLRRKQCFCSRRCSWEYRGWRRRIENAKKLLLKPTKPAEHGDGRRCSRCGQVKPNSEFHVHKTCCKACKYQIDRQKYYGPNRDLYLRLYREANRRWHARNKGTVNVKKTERRRSDALFQMLAAGLLISQTTNQQNQNANISS